MIPLIKNFKATNIINAFILAGIFQTILLSLTFSTKDAVNKLETSEFLKWLISLIYIFLITIISYIIMYIIFGFGGGMIIYT